ncbi:MAG TPA: VOC family protein, partial [Terriglobia bacterium]|nr:VOC family protein [Terriglobia bacterium]
KQNDFEQLDQAVTDILANREVQLSAEQPSVVFADLLAIARDLSSMPRPDFKARLRSALERTTSMTMKMATKTVQFREGFRTVTPYIFIPEAEGLIAFVQNVFAGIETGRSAHESGEIHSEVRIGDSMLMIGGGPSYKGPRKTVLLRVLVPNCDEVYQKALEAGAVSTLAITENYGERFGCVRDRFDNQWIISTQIGPAYSEGLEHSLTLFIKVRGAARYIDFVKQAFGAEVVLRADGPEGQVRHSIIRMGDSIVAISDAQEDAPSLLQGYLYVPDVDAWYARAVRAGAKSSLPPTDHAYGDRGAAVMDEWGNSWYMATPL